MVAQSLEISRLSQGGSGYRKTRLWEGFGLLAERLSDGEGIAYFWMFDFDGLDVAVQAHGEQVVLESFGAIEAPGVVGEGLGELEFECAYGFEVVLQFMGEAKIFGEIFAGHDDDLPGEPMTQGVEGRYFFPAFRDGAGRFQ